MTSKPVSLDKPVSPVVYRDRTFLDKHPDLGRLPE